ncbi:MAG: RusA family crossover junction endodeoxyribonuclease, partial [Megasphaera micronuciformis]|nr:RusA family crossover junction endodeoxyribonuclease [Megasphaera micronuciformis]
DNYVKGVLDALNGTVLKDDSVVCEIFARKFYSERPRIEVVLEARI